MRTADYMGTPQPTPGITFRNFTMQMLLFINELPKEKNQAWHNTCWNQFQELKNTGGATYGTCLSWLQMRYWGIRKGLSGLNTACKG